MVRRAAPIVDRQTSHCKGVRGKAPPGIRAGRPIRQSRCDLTAPPLGNFPIGPIEDPHLG